MQRSIVLVLGERAIAYEVITAAQVLSRKYPIRIATPGGKDHADESGLTYRAHMSIEAVHPEEVACLLVAGGDLGDVVEHEPLLALIRELDRRQVVLGAICAAGIVFAKAGILVGRRFTHTCIYPPSMHALFDGSDFIEQDLVVSEHIVTATPEAHIDFAIELARMLGVLDDAEAERRRGYYKGDYVRDWSLSGPVGDESMLDD